MFPVAITVSNIAELNAVIAALHPTVAAVNEAPIKPPKAEAPGKPSAAKTVSLPPTAEAGPSPSAPSGAAPAQSTEATQPAAAATSADQPAAFEYATLQKAVIAGAPKHGKAKLLTIAAKHGAVDFRALPADKWAAAYDDVVALG